MSKCHQPSRGHKNATCVRIPHIFNDGRQRLCQCNNYETVMSQVCQTTHDMTRPLVKVDWHIGSDL
mgnify:CR=1 FL=1